MFPKQVMLAELKMDIVIMQIEREGRMGAFLLSFYPLLEFKGAFVG